MEKGTNFIRIIVLTLSMVMILSGAISVFASGTVEVVQPTYKVAFSKSEYGTLEVEKEAIDIFKDKIVKVKDNSFTMPASDVRVVANFVKAQENVATTEEISEPVVTIPEKNAPLIMPFAVGSANSYVNYRNSARPSSFCAIVFTEGTAPSQHDPAYSGYIVNSTPTVAVAYSAILDNMGERSYYAPDMESYKVGGLNSGKLYATYPKALNYKGKQYDVRITINDWDIQSNRSTPISKENPALFRFNPGRPGIHVTLINSIEYFTEFFEAGTTKPVSVKGYVTFKDIDHQQGMIFKDGWKDFFVGQTAQGNIDYSVTNAGNAYFYDNHKDPADSETGASDVAHWMMATFSGSILKTTFTFLNFNYDNKGEPPWTLSTHAANGGISFDSEKLFAGPVDIEKRVSDDNEKLVISDTLNREPSPRKEDFLYTLSVTVPDENKDTTYYKKFAVIDKIDKGLEIDKANTKVVNKAGTNRTDWFDITVDSSNELRLTAKAEHLLKADFYAEIYTITIPVKIKDSTDLIPYFDPVKQMAKIDNQAFVDYDGGGVGVASNYVHTYVPTRTRTGAVEITKIDRTDATKISGVVFNVYEWSETAKAYKMDIFDTLFEDLDMVGNDGVYINSKPYIYTADNQFKFKIVETASAQGYINEGWSEEIQLTGDETQSIKYTVENEKMDPKVLIAKKADKTTNVVLENGKYVGAKDAGEYIPDQKIDFMLTATNAGNVVLHNITIKEEMDAKLLEYVKEAAYALKEGQAIKTTKGNIAILVKIDGATIVLDTLAIGDSVDVHYIATLKGMEQFTKATNLNNIVTANATYPTPDGDEEVPEDKDDDDIKVPEVKNPTPSPKPTTKPTSESMAAKSGGAKTGDTTQATLFAILGALGLAGSMTLLYKKKKQKKAIK